MQCKHENIMMVSSDYFSGKNRMCLDCGLVSHDGISWVVVKESRPVREELPGGSTPSQYALPSGAQELQDLIEYREMNFAMGNIFKACYRKKEVGDPLYDIRKIIWFAKREEARLMKEVNNG